MFFNPLKFTGPQASWKIELGWKAELQVLLPALPAPPTHTVQVLQQESLYKSEITQPVSFGPHELIASILK